MGKQQKTQHTLEKHTNTLPKDYVLARLLPGSTRFVRIIITIANQVCLSILSEYKRVGEGEGDEWAIYNRHN